MAETAREIENYIHTNPGVHFSGIVDGLGTAPGQTQYHVFNLIDSGTVVFRKLYGRTHYYPPNLDSWEQGALALLRRETTRDILIYLVRKNEYGRGVPPGEVADTHCIARSTLEWHLDHLMEQDLVTKNRIDNRVYLELREPKRIVELIGEIEPSVSEKMVDRFIRLFEGMTEE